jgi:hypothetical protein
LEAIVSESVWRPGLFESYECLVEIELCDRRVTVPEKNKLLRCFQFVKCDAVSVGDYCWNGDCTNCQVWYQGEDGQTRSALACKLYVKQGMVITRVSENLRADVIDS